MISEPGDGRIYVTTPDGLWSFNSSAHNVPRAAFDALRERCEKLEAALGEIGGSEERICNYCEGEGNRYADGKAHYYSEHAPTILCPECGGRGRIRDMDSEDMAAVANAALATEVKP